MKQEDNKEFNAAYDLIHQNSIKIPDKIAFIDDNQTINYSNLSKKVKSFSNQIFHLLFIGRLLRATKISSISRISQPWLRMNTIGFLTGI